jgi:hypothetical protein
VNELARLTDIHGRYIDVSLLAYASSNREYDFDANSLIVRLAAWNGERYMGHEGSEFLTWELAILVRWMRLLGNGKLMVAEEYSTVTVHRPMEFYIVQAGDPTHLRVDLGGWAMSKEER